MIGDFDLFYKVTEANKGKCLSSRYLSTYNLYSLHINIADLYDETQGHIQKCHEPTICIASI